MKRPGRIIKLCLIVLLMQSALTGCLHDEFDTSALSRSGSKITVEVFIPGFEVPKTRSIADEQGEAVVQTIDLMIFDRSNVPKLLQRYTTDKVMQSVSAPYYVVSLEVPADLFKNAGVLAVVANASATVDEALKENRVEKPTIMSWLKYHTIPDKNGDYKWNTSSPGYTPIPMYGERVLPTVTAGMKITDIELTRMLARIDVENQVNGEIFDLQEIYVVNYHTGGFVTPAWNNQTGALLKEGDTGYPYTANLDPKIPDTAIKQPGTEEKAMKYIYDQEDNASGSLLAGQIYTFEEPKVLQNKKKEAICLILKGNYRGEECYYRVDFTSDKKISNPATGTNVEIGDHVPLYRNHKYVVTVQAAEGVGYASFEEALQSTAILSNLRTSLLIVDMTGINNIVFNGQYFMGTENRQIDFPWGIRRSLKCKVSSDYTGNWTAEILEYTKNRWLRFQGGGVVLSGTDINQNGLDIILDALPFFDNSSEYPAGRIAFSAGRLRDTLTVRRVPIADMFARSNIVYETNKLLFAVDESDNAVIPAHSQGVFFKWGTLIAFSPDGNPYIPGNHVIYNPANFNPAELTPPSTTNGMDGWDKIPYAHLNFQFVPGPVSGKDSDAFREYSSQTGYDELAGIGDICRYITEQPGWVEGKWRLPTGKELEMLYQETGGNSVGIDDFTNIAETATSSDGKYLIASGRFMGAKVTSATATVANRSKPPAGTVFLPASGHRYPNGYGKVVHVNAYGYYWSSSPCKDYTVYYPLIHKTDIEFSDADRSYAFPVRCIRDY